MPKSDNSLPSDIDPSVSGVPWSPTIVIVCRVTLQPDASTSIVNWAPKFDKPNSWTYIPQDWSTFDICEYAGKVADGTARNTGNNVTWTAVPNEFVVSGPCYVVISLDPIFSWQFKRNASGLTMAEDVGGKYSNLFHVQLDYECLPGSNSSLDGCEVIHFEADVPYADPQPPATQDYFNLYYEFRLPNSYTAREWDPDIKNTGRPKLTGP